MRITRDQLTGEILEYLPEAGSYDAQDPFERFCLRQLVHPIYKKDENGKVKNEKAPDFRVYLSEATKSSSAPKQEATKEADTASVPSTDEEVLF